MKTEDVKSLLNELKRVGVPGPYVLKVEANAIVDYKILAFLKEHDCRLERYPETRPGRWGIGSDTHAR